MHKDFSDLLSIFTERNVRYLIVGGYAYARYTEPRATKDLDLFLSPDSDNASRVWTALLEFGANLAGVTQADFSEPNTILQIGVPPVRIDLLFRIDGVGFEEAWTTSETATLENGVPVRYISADRLIANKLAASRPQDLVDVQKLRAAFNLKPPGSESRS